MNNHEGKRPVPFGPRLWASLIECIRQGLVVAWRHAPQEVLRKQAEEAVGALEALESLQPEECLHCALRDTVAAHGEAHMDKAIAEAISGGWNPDDPQHLDRQHFVLAARLAALGKLAGELVRLHLPNTKVAFPAVVIDSRDRLLMGYTDGLGGQFIPHDDGVEVIITEEDRDFGPAGFHKPLHDPVVDDATDESHPPKNKLH